MNSNGGAVLNRALLERSRPNAKFPSSPNDSFSKLQRNLAKEFEGRPLLRPAEIEIPNFGEKEDSRIYQRYFKAPLNPSN